VAQSCWPVYVVDLVEYETGPNIYVGTSRLSSQLIIILKCYFLALYKIKNLVQNFLKPMSNLEKVGLN